MPQPRAHSQPLSENTSSSVAMASEDFAPEVCPEGVSAPASVVRRAGQWSQCVSCQQGGGLC